MVSVCYSSMRMTSLVGSLFMIVDFPPKISNMHEYVIALKGHSITWHTHTRTLLASCHVMYLFWRLYRKVLFLHDKIRFRLWHIHQRFVQTKLTFASQMYFRVTKIAFECSFIEQISNKTQPHSTVKYTIDRPLMHCMHLKIMDERFCYQRKPDIIQCPVNIFSRIIHQ